MSNRCCRCKTGSCTSCVCAKSGGVCTNCASPGCTNAGGASSFGYASSSTSQSSAAYGTSSGYSSSYTGYSSSYTSGPSADYRQPSTSTCCRCRTGNCDSCACALKGQACVNCASSGCINTNSMRSTAGYTAGLPSRSYATGSSGSSSKPAVVRCCKCRSGNCESCACGSRGKGCTSCESPSCNNIQSTTKQGQHGPKSTGAGHSDQALNGTCCRCKTGDCVGCACGVKGMACTNCESSGCQNSKVHSIPASSMYERCCRCKSGNCENCVCGTNGKACTNCESPGCKYAPKPSVSSVKAKCCRCKNGTCEKCVCGTNGKACTNCESPGCKYAPKPSVSSVKAKCCRCKNGTCEKCVCGMHGRACTNCESPGCKYAPKPSVSSVKAKCCRCKNGTCENCVCGMHGRACTNCESSGCQNVSNSSVVSENTKCCSCRSGTCKNCVCGSNGEACTNCESSGCQNVNNSNIGNVTLQFCCKCTSGDCDSCVCAEKGKSCTNCFSPYCENKRKGLRSQDVKHGFGLKRQGHRMVHVNAQSLIKKMDKIRDLLAKEPVSILGVSETWFKGDMHDLDPQVPGYKLFRKDRPGEKEGGGVALYVKDSNKCREVPGISSGQIESLWVEVSFPDKQAILIGTMYRPPKENVGWYDHFEKELTRACNNYDNVVLGGDFNIDMFDVTRNARMNAIPRDKGLHQVITEPTHFFKLIDLVYVSDADKVVETTVPRLGAVSLGDHSPVCITWKSK